MAKKKPKRDGMFVKDGMTHVMFSDPVGCFSKGPLVLCMTCGKSKKLTLDDSADASYDWFDHHAEPAS